MADVDKIVEKAKEGLMSEVLEELRINPQLINRQNEDGRTVLIAACKEGHRELVYALLRAGADMNIVSSVGKSGFMWAASFGHAQIISTLLSAGCDINIKSTFGQTAWNSAATPVIKHLIEDHIRSIVREQMSSAATPPISIRGVNLKSEEARIALELDEDFSNLSSEEQLTYLWAKYSQVQFEIRRSRLLLVGQGTGGKTTLVARLKDQVFLSHPPMTNGVSMSDIEIRGIRFTVMDFAGQREYVHTHRLFFSKSAVYLLVHSPRLGGESQLESYFDMIATSAPQAVVILVTTYADHITMSPEQVESIRNRFTQVAEVVAVDSSTGTGIDRLRLVIEQQALRLESTITKMPASFLRLQQLLEAVVEAAPALFSIPSAQFQGLAECDAGMTPSLVGIAKKMFCLWGNVHELSNGDVVIRPQQLADVLADVFTRSPAHLERLGTTAKDGLLRYDPDVLEVIWGRYSRELWYCDDNVALSPFINLLHQSGLAYPLFTAEGRPLGASLIPALLPESPNPDLIPSDPTYSERLLKLYLPDYDNTPIHASLSLEFHYLPGSFLGQLQVRLRRLVAIGGSWRTGCVLVNSSHVTMAEPSFAVLYQDHNSIVVLSAGVDESARLVALNAVMDLMRTEYPELYKKSFKDIVLAMEDRRWHSDEIVENLRSPGYVQSRKGYRVSVVSLRILFPDISHGDTSPRTSAEAISSLTRDQDPPHCQGHDRVTLPEQLRRLDELLLTPAPRGEGEVNVGLQLARCIPEVCAVIAEDLRLLWVVVQQGEDLFAVPVSPGVSWSDPWVIILEARLPCADRSPRGPHENKALLESFGVIITQALQRIKVFIPHKYTLLPSLSALRGADVDNMKLAEVNHFIPLDGVCIYWKFHASAQGMALAREQAKESDAKTCLVNRSLEALAIKVDHTNLLVEDVRTDLRQGFGDLRESVASLRILVSDQIDSLRTLWEGSVLAMVTAWETQEQNLKITVERNMRSLEREIADRVQTMGDRRGVDEGKFVEAFQVQFNEMKESLLSSIKKQDTEEGAKILGELRGMQAQLSQLVTLTSEAKKSLELNSSVMRKTIINLHLRTFPTLFVMLDAASYNREPGAEKGVIARMKNIFQKIMSPAEELAKSLRDREYLALLCEVCCAPQLPPYTITKPKEIVRKILPLAKVGLTIVSALNSVSRLGACMGLPSIDVQTMREARAYIRYLGKDSLDDFKNLQSAVRLTYDGEGDGKPQVAPLGYCAREFGMFLKQVDPNSIWGGISQRVTDSGCVTFLCPRCLASTQS